MKDNQSLIDIVKEQEEAFVFDNINIKTIVQISKNLALSLGEKNAPVYVIAVINDVVVYSEMLPGASKDNYHWAVRKGNTALLLNKSSYRATLEFALNNKDFSNRGLPVKDYALSGGAFPIKVGDIAVGYFAVSGMTQEEDHQSIVNALSSYFSKNVDSILL